MLFENMHTHKVIDKMPRHFQFVIMGKSFHTLGLRLLGVKFPYGTKRTVL